MQQQAFARFGSRMGQGVEVPHSSTMGAVTMGYQLTIKPATHCQISHLSTNMSTKPPFLQALELLILSTKLGNRAQNPNKARVTSRIEQMVDWAGFESCI
jgi:hypothetical protein